MGLGLSIVKSYVNILGGNISVNSELNKGTEFIIELPYLPVEIKKESSDILKNIELKGDGKKLLIVEDVADNAELIKEYLMPYNFNILFANNGLKAIEIVKNHKDISLILLDIKMPEMDGYEVCRNIFQINPNITVIGITAFTQEEELNKMKFCGMKAILSKPLSKDILIQTLENFLN